jgi:hypothetical protein
LRCSFLLRIWKQVASPINRLGIPIPSPTPKAIKSELPRAGFSLSAGEEDDGNGPSVCRVWTLSEADPPFPVATVVDTDPAVAVAAAAAPEAITCSTVASRVAVAQYPSYIAIALDISVVTPADKVEQASLTQEEIYADAVEKISERQ